MKTKGRILLDEIKAALEPPEEAATLDGLVLSADSIQDNFKKKLAEFGLDHMISVGDVEIGEEGDVAVSLHDQEGIPYTISFQYDEKEGPQAFIISDAELDSPDEEESEDDAEDDSDSDDIVFDLAVYNPAVIQTKNGSYMNLADLSWLSPDLLCQMLQAAGAQVSLNPPHHKVEDEFGNFVKDESLDELFVTRVIGGRKQRVNLVRRIGRKKRLTPKQRAGIRRATQKRKREMRQIVRKRRKSTAVRKRLHLKPGHRPKGFRIKR